MKNIFLALFTALLLSLATPAFADTLIIDNIEVDQTAANSVEAQKKALNRAQKEAFYAISESLIKQNSGAEIPEPSAEALNQMVKSYEVREEKISAKRYKGIFKITFSAAKVADFLAFNGIEASGNKTEKILLIPVLHNRETTLLWNEDNSWREQFEKLSNQFLMNPYIIPAGDLNDIALFNENDVRTGNKTALAKLAEKYKTPTAILVEASFNNIGDIEVRISSSNTLFSEDVLKTFPINYGFKKIAEESFSIVKNQLETKPQETFKKNHVNSIVHAKNVKEWLGIREILEKTIGLENFNITSIEKGEVLLDIYYEQDIAELEQKLSSAGLNFSVNNDVYEISIN